MAYVVIVDWHVKLASAEGFARLAKAQAQNSLEQEADCLYFDLCRSGEEPTRFFMYEIYTDRAAFDLHLASDHFKRFSADIADLVDDKVVATFEKL
ncbi:MAG: putative quinol monooxygenase [Pseudomonadota bacterium]